MNCPPDQPHYQPILFPASQGHDRRRDRNDIDLCLDISSSVILISPGFHISYEATADACWLCGIIAAAPPRSAILQEGACPACGRSTAFDSGG
jgi:hypothetical protein